MSDNPEQSKSRRAPNSDWEGPWAQVFPKPGEAKAESEVSTPTPEASVSTSMPEVPELESAREPKEPLGKIIARLENALATPTAKPAETVVEPEKTPAPRERKVAPHHHELHAPQPAESARPVDKLDKFAAGAAQSGKHYDEAMGLSEVQSTTPESPDYENMDTDQLVAAAAKAEMAGDTATLNQITEVFEEEYTRPGSEMTYEEYDSDITLFKELVELKVQYEIKKGSNRVAVEHDEDAVVEAKGEKAEESKDIFKLNELVLYKGKEVRITDIYKTADGKVGYGIFLPRVGNTLMPADKVSAIESDKSPESPTEKIKAFWNKNKDFVVEKFTMGYMAAKWAIEDSIINRGIDPMTTNFEDANKMRRQRRIALFAGVMGVVLVSALAKDINALHLFGGPGIDFAGPLGGGAPTPGAEHASDALAGHTPEPVITDTPTPSHTDGVAENQFSTTNLNHNLDDPAYTLTPVDQAPTTATPDVAPLTPISTPEASIPITPGEGGYQLFNREGISDSLWNQNAPRWLIEHPQNFYQMPGGGIGLEDIPITDPKLLSEMNALKP